MSTTPSPFTASTPFPFSAVVGQEPAKRALLLTAIDPAIGGVLLRGDKGSGKSTLARGLAELLPEDAPFVELPVGATEDRLFGSLDLQVLVDDPGADPAKAFRPGLLDAAHGGVLYVDEVNLLPDHLVDGLLDAAASGVNRLERDGVSHEHPARFVLLGSMNPEEGELRPQLLDRFGLAVEIRSPEDPGARAEAVRRRLVHDAGRTSPDADDGLRQRLVLARPASLPDEVIGFAASLAVSMGAESLRADLVLCRAAAALAGWEGRPSTTDDHVTGVAPLVLGHRRRRRPFDPPTLPPEELESALERLRQQATAAEGQGESRSDGEARGEAGGGTGDADGDPPAGPAGRAPRETGQEPGERSGRDGDGASGAGHDGRAGDDGRTGDDGRATGDGSGAAPAPDGAGTTGTAPAQGAGEPGPGPSPGRDRTDGDGVDRTVGRRWDDLAGGSLGNGGDGSGGRVHHELPERQRQDRTETAGHGPGARVGHAAPGPDGPGSLAVLPTVRAMVERRASDPDGPALIGDDLREDRRARPVPRTIVLAVDASGSMGTTARVQAASEAVMGLLADAYLARDQVALVAFRGDGAHEVLPPTGSVELARARLADLPTGGSTPLGEGIAAALATARRVVARGGAPLLVMLTDGRATGASGALDDARAAAEAVADAGVAALVLDAEDAGHPTRLGLAAELAELMGARCVRLPSVAAPDVESAVRTALGRR